MRGSWSLVTMGYQPEMAAAWSACTRAFAAEARQDQVFEESVFWIVTRVADAFQIPLERENVFGDNRPVATEK
jgi:hypothetical protein